jgi:hypothetical protein
LSGSPWLSVVPVAGMVDAAAPGTPTNSGQTASMARMRNNPKTP